MYGYIRINKPEMKIKEYEIYKGFYCSLCKTLKRRYGILSPLLLSYDLTFFSLFSASIHAYSCDFKRCRCAFNPAKKCICLSRRSEYEEFAADLTVLLAYFKLKDAIADSRFLKKLLLYILLPYFIIKKRKAANLQPDAYRHAQILMLKQFRVEASPVADLDLAAEPTALFTAYIAKTAAPKEKKTLAESFGYMIGRYIYLADAYDDIKKDLKTGNYNPFIAQFSITNDNLSESSKKCASVLELTAASAIERYEAINTENYGEILDNIIKLGFFDKIDQISEKYKEATA